MEHNTNDGKVAILLMAYGTPRTKDEIEPYYTDIRHGHAPEPAQLEELQQRYAAIGGKSPLLEITTQQAQELQQRTGVKTYIGMKHWHPYLSETMESMKADGVTKLIALALAPHYTKMGMGGYIERLEKAREGTHADMEITYIERWGEDPVYINSICERIEAAKQAFTVPSFDAIEVIFSAHSLPKKILKDKDPYVEELTQTMELAAAQLSLPHYHFAFQSAGRTDDEWIGPDILDDLRVMQKKDERRQVLVAPVGFISDHLEILYDLDIETAALANELGLEFRRTRSGNTTDTFIDALVHVVEPYL